MKILLRCRRPVPIGPDGGGLVSLNTVLGILMSMEHATLGKLNYLLEMTDLLMKLRFFNTEKDIEATCVACMDLYLNCL